MITKVIHGTIGTRIVTADSPTRKMYIPKVSSGHAVRSLAMPKVAKEDDIRKKPHHISVPDTHIEGDCVYQDFIDWGNGNFLGIV